MTVTQLRDTQPVCVCVLPITVFSTAWCWWRSRSRSCLCQLQSCRRCLCSAWPMKWHAVSAVQLTTSNLACTYPHCRIMVCLCVCV
jgi:hypothetical protein